MADPRPTPTTNAESQAGGGTSTYSDSHALKVDDIHPVTAKYIEILFKEISERYDLSTKDGIQQFLSESQSHSPDEIHIPDVKLTSGHFKSYFQTHHAAAMGKPARLDTGFSISNYFVSSSHNTYLTGNQLYSDSSTDPYKNVLLRGCRCVEIDVWDGEPPSASSSEDEDEGGMLHRMKSKMEKKIEKRLSRSPRPTRKEKKQPVAEADAATSAMPKPWRSQCGARAEPRVLHGYTATKEIPFRAVCQTIKDYAFVSSDLPVIISFEVHTSLEQQEIMVEIINECWADYLIPVPPVEELMDPNKTRLPKLEDLRRKILIKVKFSPPKPKPAPGDEPPRRDGTPEDPDSSSPSDSSDDEAEKRKKKGPKPKMLDKLCHMGVYTRSYHFKSFDQPEATVPTHIFSLSEGTLLEVHTKDPSALFKHNKDYLMRAYPKGSRLTSTNLDPAIFWRQGVQIVALNWQTWDEGTMLNEGMFAGTGGWVRKPSGYLSASASTHHAHANAYVTLNLDIEVFAGQDIPLPLGAKSDKGFNPYVKCELHVEKPEERNGQPIPGGGKSKEADIKESTGTGRGRDPDFNREVVRFRDVEGVAPELSFVRFKVLDDEIGRDDLAAWACFRLDRLQSGFRMVHLFDAEGLQSQGVLLVRITKKFVSEAAGPPAPPPPPPSSSDADTDADAAALSQKMEGTRV